jgi:hypothetical protein
MKHGLITPRGGSPFNWTMVLINTLGSLCAADAYRLRYFSKRKIAMVAVRKSHLEVAAGCYGDVLHAVDRIGDGRRIDSRSEVELPKLCAGGRIEGVEIALTLAHEKEVSRRRKRSANQRLLCIVLPGYRLTATRYWIGVASLEPHYRHIAARRQAVNARVVIRR